MKLVTKTDGMIALIRLQEVSDTRSLEQILENHRIWNHKVMFPVHVAAIKLPDCGTCRYGVLCGRIQEQIDEVRLRIAATKTQLYMSDHTLDQALLQWKYEYLVKQEKWLIELMCGKREEEKQEEKQ